MIIESEKRKKKGLVFAGSTEAWAAHAVEGSIGCRDRLICSEGRARANLWGLIIGWTHLPYEKTSLL